MKSKSWIWAALYHNHYFYSYWKKNLHFNIFITTGHTVSRGIRGFMTTFMHWFFNFKISFFFGLDVSKEFYEFLVLLIIVFLNSSGDFQFIILERAWTLRAIRYYTLSSAFLGWRSLKFLKSSSIFLLVALALDFASFLKRILLN